MKRIIYLLFFLCSFEGMSQVNIDSLWKVWNNTANPDTVRLEAMGIISFDGYIYSNSDSAFYCAQLQYNFAKKCGNKKYQAQALNTQGTSFYMRGDHGTAIDFYTKSLKIREEIGDKRGEASCINNIGAIYTDQGQPEKALDCYKRSLKIREAIGDKDGMAASYNNIGAIYAEQMENTLAIEYYTRSLKIREEIGDQIGIGTAYNNMGRVYTYLNDVRKARDYYHRGLAIRERNGDVRGQAMSLYNIGVTYVEEDINKAIDYNERSLKISRDAGFVSHISYSSLALYEYYKKTGRYKDALEMYELYTKMNDSIKSENSQKEVMQQEMQYTYEKQKALDVKEHEKQNAIAAEQKNKQRIIIYASTTGLLLVLLFAVFVFNRLRITRKQKNIIEEQKGIVDQKQGEILDSINYAKRLQDAILPRQNLVKEHFKESFILYKPKDIVAGDFYWLEQKNNMLFFAVADCTGHGVPGAMVSVVCSNALNRAVLEFGITEPGKILDKTRELVSDTFSKSDTDVKDGMDISLICINKETNVIKWAGANNPLWYLQNKEMRELKADKQSIGKTENALPFTTHTIAINKGDSLFLFTDGFADQFGGEKGKKLKYKPMKELLLNISALSMEEQSIKLESAFDNWKLDLEQVDDVCIIGIRI
ncbi:MAG TPA: tetratricopeptide repeat protein [Bacteroidia bacterium]|jgi:serine phosphatase RsbU (regulator of sigma subunit)